MHKVEDTTRNILAFEGERIPNLAGTDVATLGRPEMLFPGRDKSLSTRHTILLAEDDDDLRTVMTYFLESLGFDVVACCNANVASEAFQCLRAVDLLMTDFQMPGRSGIELAYEITAMRPSLPVLILSASILPDTMLKSVREQGWVFLAKPCQMNSLVNAISLLLHTNRELAA